MLDKLLENTTYETIKKDLNNAGYKFDNIDINEELEPYSDNISWDCTFEVTNIRANKNYSITLSGTAFAEISYERWVGSFGHDIEDYSIKEI